MADTSSPTLRPGARVTVMGLGSFGGGVGAARFLAGRGAQVTVTDLRDDEALADSCRQLDGVPGINWRLGEHREEDFRDVDLVVVNPAVASESPWVEIARQSGALLTTEIGLFWQLNPGRTIAVTGSNGKSTTAAMIHAILDAGGEGRTWLGGNIGGSLLEQLDAMASTDWVVLELSSFQLEHLDRQKAAAEIAVVTNLTPNHLDRHHTLDAYRHAKQAILRWQSPGQAAVLSSDDPDVAGWTTAGCRLGFGRDTGCGAGVFLGEFADADQAAIVRVGEVSREIPLGGWVRIPGRHNLHNAAAATAAALLAGAGIADVRRGLQQFAGLPHRLQLVAECRGRRFYNDSLATTPESVAVALAAFDDPVVLLAGGYDKQIPLAGLADSIGEHAKAIALMGETAGMLDRHLADQSNQIPRSVCGSLEQAFAWAIAQSSPGDNILLSPGCASYDWFTSFRERGKAFEQLARGWRQAA